MQLWKLILWETDRTLSDTPEEHRRPVSQDISKNLVWQDIPEWSVAFSTSFLTHSPIPLFDAPLDAHHDEVVKICIFAENLGPPPKSVKNITWKVQKKKIITNGARLGDVK